MKHSLGRRPLEVKFAFILVVTLLMPGVTSRSIVSTATTTSNVSSGPKPGGIEEDEFNLESNSEAEDLTEPDGSLEDHTEAVRDINETETGDLEEPALVNNETATSITNDEEDALALFSLLVKRAVDEEMEDDSEEDNSETNSVDEDNFSISDLPKLLKPLIDAFSDDSNSEAPSKDDFLSWFPSLKDLFDSKKPKGTEATNTATRSGRRSSFSAASEPSLENPPVSVQPPSSQPEVLIASVPTVTKPPITISTPPVIISKRPITIDPSDDADSDEDSETNF